jgi:quinol monooxygenase YgiN
VAEASEPETLRFDFYEDPNDDSVIFLYEVCTNEAGFEGHKAGEPFQQFIGGIAEECIESMDKLMDWNTSTWMPSQT